MSKKYQKQNDFQHVIFYPPIYQSNGDKIKIFSESHQFGSHSFLGRLLEGVYIKTKE